MELNKYEGQLLDVNDKEVETIVIRAAGWVAAQIEARKFLDNLDLLEPSSCWLYMAGFPYYKWGMPLKDGSKFIFRRVWCDEES